MKFKLDENIGRRSARLFPEAGHNEYRIHGRAITSPPVYTFSGTANGWR
jgi:hypothetical protein